MFRPVAPNTLETNTTNNMGQVQSSGNNSNYGVMTLHQDSNLQYTAKIYTQAEAGTSYTSRQLQSADQSSPSSMQQQQQNTNTTQFYFTTPNPMLSQEPMPMRMNLVQEQMAPPPPNKCPPQSTSTKNNDGFAVPHVNKVFLSIKFSYRIIKAIFFFF